MSETCEFTRNSNGETVQIVVGKITHFERDKFSDCTTLHLEGGGTIGVSESIDYVKDAIADA